MAMRKAGSTADGAALGRAIHLLYERPVIFADYYAIDLVGEGARRAARSPLLYRLFLRRGLRPFRSFLASTLTAMRFVEERLTDAIHEGTSQYVVLGAGLDSFALRRLDLCRRLHVFEVDHPTTQELKRERIAAFLGEIPAHLEFVPVDFERQSLEEGLAGSSFDASRKTLFSWIASIPYVEEPAVYATFESLARHSAPGSEVVFNFAMRGVRADASIGKLQRTTRSRGEPLKSAFEPDELLGKLEAMGFEKLDLLSGPDLTERYLAGRSDGLEVAPFGYLARIRRAS